VNKLVKGAVAGAAGIALLLGGASTFALWNQSATANAGIVQSGQLSLEKSATSGTWTDLSTGTARTLTAGEVAAYRLVPGSKLQFSQPITVVARGTGLKATLAAQLPGSTSALGAALVKQFTLSGVSGAALPAGIAQSGDTWTVAPTGSAELRASLLANYTITLPDTTEGTAAQNGSVDLGQLAFTLTQTPLAG